MYPRKFFLKPKTATSSMTSSSLVSAAATDSTANDSLMSQAVTRVGYSQSGDLDHLNETGVDDSNTSDDDEKKAPEEHDDFKGLSEKEPKQHLQEREKETRLLARGRQDDDEKLDKKLDEKLDEQLDEKLAGQLDENPDEKRQEKQRQQPEKKMQQVPAAPAPTPTPTPALPAPVTPRPRPGPPENMVYPSGLKLFLLLVSSFSSMFLVSLDRLILATALPQISDEFHSVDEIGWYGSAYMLTNCAFQLMFGKLYMYFSIKTVFLSTILLFETGSAICGSAPNSVAFIMGRAIAGIGSGGIFSGVIMVIVYAVPLHKRPLYQGLFGAVFGLSSVVGPLLGGAFTTNVSWRWCFYINLPFGGIAMVLIFFLLNVPDRETTQRTLRQKLAQLDIAGTTVFIPGCISLLLALQWGGSKYAWSNGRIIALFVLSGVLLSSFVAIQILMPKTATIPPRIFKQRSIMFGFFSTFCIGAQMMIFIYFLPIWFQAIQGVSAVQSGIRTLPLVLGMVVASTTTGALISRVGYYTPFMIWGICLMSIGSGLLSTLQVNTPQSKWVGYQFLFGWGLGNTFQAPNLAAQTVLPRPDVPIGTSLVFFSQLLSGSIFVSVGQNVLNSQLIQRLNGIAGLNAASILNNGATSIVDLPGPLRSIVLRAYNESLRRVFHVGLILVCLTIIGALGMEWRSVKKSMQQQQQQQQQQKTLQPSSTTRSLPSPNSHVATRNLIAAEEGKAIGPGFKGVPGTTGTETPELSADRTAVRLREQDLVKPHIVEADAPHGQGELDSREMPAELPGTELMADLKVAKPKTADIKTAD